MYENIRKAPSLFPDNINQIIQNLQNFQLRTSHQFYGTFLNISHFIGHLYLCLVI